MKTSKVDNHVQSKPKKHVPLRTCVACRRLTSKRELIRLVCSSDIVQVDPKGKMPGRGVYICPDYSCWVAGLKGNRIEHGLRTTLSAQNRQSLFAYGNSLPIKGK